MKLTALYIGQIREISPNLPSAIDKQATNERLWLSQTGLSGDQQGDAKLHGGLERALHHYPLEHYPDWQARYPQHSWRAPAFGENLSTQGVTEAQIHIGDTFRWGQALIQVSQPRSPCYRLGKRWGIAELPRVMQQSGHSGWLYRVLEPGWVSAADPLDWVDASTEQLSVAEAFRWYLQEPRNLDGLQRLLSCPALCPRWQDTARKRLESGQLEDWSKRLTGVETPGGH